MSLNLDNLWKKGKDFLGTEKSILCGAMSWISNRNLVSAVSNAGGFGVIACGSMDSNLLDNEIKKTKELTSKPFGVNLITMHPEIDKLAEVCVANKVKHVILAGGLPSNSTIKFLKENNIKVICFATTIALSRRLVEKMNVDALIIEGSEAGGHIGPVSTSVMTQEILPIFKEEIPVFIAGGIGSGKQIASYLLMGAAGCQLGTRFVFAHECDAHENFKNAFIRANARDAQPTVQVDKNFPIIPVRSIKNQSYDIFVEYQKSVIKDFHDGKVEKKEAQLNIEKFWAGALKKAVIDGDVDTGSVMCGQSVGLINKLQSTQEIINELEQEAQEFLNHLKSN